MPTRSPTRDLPSRTDAFRSHGLLRLGGWGGAATLALATAIAAARSDTGVEHAKADLAAMQGPGPIAKLSPAQSGDPASGKFAAWSSGVEQEMRRQADVIRSLADQRDGLAEKVSGVERQLNELGGLMTRATARLESEAKSAREAAAAASSSAATAASAARLAQARQEQARQEQARQDQPKNEQARRDAPEIPSPAAAAPPALSPVAATSAVSVPPAAMSVARPAWDAPPSPAPAVHGQIPGIAPGGAIYGTPPTSGPPVSAAPAYTGTIPMPAASSEPAGAPVLVRPFPAQAAAQAASQVAVLAAAQESAQENTRQSAQPHGQPNAPQTTQRLAEQIAQAAAMSGGAFDPWGGVGSVPPVRPGATKPQPRPPAPAAAPGHAPSFQANPLMTAGIFDGPAEPGGSAGEFAIDLGGGTTVEALRARWNALRASESPLFDNLKPLVALKDGGKSGQELHLIAGPLASSAATARFCAVLSGGGVPCLPSLFEGQHLAAR